MFKFKFYTYDKTGRDRIVTIEAKSQREAQKVFNTLFPGYPVDFVRKEPLTA